MDRVGIKFHPPNTNTHNLQIFFVIIDIEQLQHVRVLNQLHDRNFSLHLGGKGWSGSFINDEHNQVNHGEH